MGERRRLDMGLLVKHDKASAERFKLLLNQLAREYSVGINEPYSAMDLNHTVDLHIAPRALPHLAIEIRQDHIDTEAGVARFVKLIGDALKSML